MGNIQKEMLLMNLVLNMDSRETVLDEIEDDYSIDDISFIEEFLLEEDRNFLTPDYDNIYPIESLA